MSYSIPGRPTAPAGGPAESPSPIGPLQVSAPTPIAPVQEAWWLFTAPESGRVIFDTLLSDPIYGFGSVSLWLYTADLTFVDNTGSGQLTRDVEAGDYLVQVKVEYGPAVTAYLRVSDYADMTDWIADDPLPVVAGPPSAMNWNVLPDFVGYPAPDGYQPDVLPDPVVFQYPVTGAVAKYLNPWSPGIQFLGAAEMLHTPDPEEIAPHPYERTENWQDIWGAALGGINRDRYDREPQDTISRPMLTDETGASGAEGDGAPPNSIWISESTFVDWPIGRKTTSSGIDSSPPDGHQTISDTTYEHYWHASITKAITDGSTVAELDPTINGEEPTDSPDPEWTLQWNPDDETRVVSVEARNMGRSDGLNNPADLYGAYNWHVSRQPLIWDGDGDYQNGIWTQNVSGPNPENPFDPSTNVEGDAYSAVVVDGLIDRAYDPATEYPLNYGEFHHVIGGSHPVPGIEVAVIPQDETDWVEVVTEAEVDDAIAYEAPLLATEAPGGFGWLWLGAILRAHTDLGDIYPSLGLGPVVEGPSNYLQFPGLRFIFQRKRHRWVGTPVIPDVIIGAPVTRQHPRDDGRGLSAGPRLYPPSKAQRLHGGLR